MIDGKFEHAAFKKSIRINEDIREASFNPLLEDIKKLILSNLC